MLALPLFRSIEYKMHKLTLSDDVLAAALEVDGQLIFQMHPRMKAFLSKQML